jgi:hypothetical protein
MFGEDYRYALVVATNLAVYLRVVGDFNEAPELDQQV